MSRLRELRLHGFKSFADPTRFVFERGINAVLGPNGSGKSNMADAVRWVLGEQSNRSLRTRRADDVIFAGSESRRPQGMAEAILTLDNSDGWLPIDFAEVSVGRRAYRSGESEYLINGARARLRDVVELLGEGRLGANELVVVGQGTVDAALSLRPEERRQLFEEAAGVKGLQVKRNEASGRLAKALDNLSRVADLVGELKPQVRRLALQAEHQQQHDALGARARALVIASHRRREQAARAALGDARRAAAAAEAELEAYRSADVEGRAALVTAEAAYWEAEERARALAAAREATREAVIRAEGRLEAVEARIGDLQRQLAAEEEALAEAERIAGVDEPEPDDEAVAAALRRAAAAESGWRAALAALAEADARLLSIEDDLARLRSRESDRLIAAARASEEIARRDARAEHLASERVAAASELEAARRASAAADATLADAQAARDRAAEGLSDAERARDAAQRKADDASGLVLELGERIRAARAEREALAGPADSGNRLSARLASTGWAALLDAIEAPESGWAAVEAVVGGELQSALLWREGDLTEQVAGARGSARLVATNGSTASEINGRDAALDAVAGDRTLDEWLGLADAPAVFRRTVVARDLRALLDGWQRLPAGWSAVTQSGDLADSRGVVTLRGRGDPPGGAAARAHARRRELDAELGRLETDLTAAQTQSHEAAERLRAARAAHLAAADAMDAAERDVRAAREDQHAAALALTRTEGRVSALDAEHERLSAAPPPSSAQTAMPSDELGRLQEDADRARADRDLRAGERDAARTRWIEARAAAEAAETLTVDQRRDRAAREARVAQLRSSLPSTRAALEAAHADRAAIADATAAARTSDAAAAEALLAAERERATRRSALLDLERERSQAGGRLAELERAAQAAASETSRRDEALVSLARERELALEGLPPVGAGVELPVVDDLDDATLEAELHRVRRTLAQIGAVNPFAVDEHRELAARLDDMTSQERDLRDAIASTEELIGRLDSDITHRFDTAFRAIAERFDEFCRLLFAGGSASLSLGDAEDGESPGGIEIVVRPPGKRLQRLSMLSGGERALTGVALLFAMLTVNPVPFCILDEVDAALDEANIGRFAQALRRLSESIDFVVITHNRATIEVADTIYGVTMTDAAVSRVLSLRLADLPAEVLA